MMWKKYLNLVKPFDLIIITLLILLSFVPTAFFSIQGAENEDTDSYAVISIDGEEVERLRLTGNTEHREMVFYPGPDQYNVVELDGERIRNKEDNSPKQIAVKRDWIQNPGETSINLPHRFLIEIVSETPQASEVDVVPQ